MSYRPVFPVVFFDLDGTLVDSSMDIAVSVNHVRLELGMDRLSESLIQTYIGDGVEKLFNRALGSEDPELIKKAIHIWRPQYENSCMVHTEFYPEIFALLTDLTSSGAKLAILTNKPQRPTEIILDGFGILHMFSAVVGGDATPTRKPKPEMFDRAIDLAGAKAEEIIHIGDSHNDVKGARDRGLKTCGVTWGYGAHDEIKEADYIVNTTGQLHKLLIREI